MVARLSLRLSHLICEEDCAPLLVSWAIALSAAIAWLLLVYLTPPAPSIRAIPDVAAPAGDGIVTVEPGAAYRATPNTAGKAPGPVVVRRHTAASPLDFAGAFAAAAVLRGVAEATSVIAGAQTVRGDVGRPMGRVDKSDIGATSGGATPGMTPLGASSGSGSAGAGLGNVQRGPAIERATFHAKALPIVTAPALDGTTADATELASFVRARVAQLQSCYELARGTDLAGVVALRITLGAAGAVRGARCGDRAANLVGLERRRDGKLLVAGGAGLAPAVWQRRCDDHAADQLHARQLMGAAALAPTFFAADCPNTWHPPPSTQHAPAQSPVRHRAAQSIFDVRHRRAPLRGAAELGVGDAQRPRERLA